MNEGTNTVHVRADAVVVGMQLVERDGALLEVVRVEHLPRVVVRIVCRRPTGPIPTIVVPVRASSLVRVFVPDGIDVSLHAAITAAGWRSEPRAEGDQRQGRRVYDERGNDLGVLTAHETWVLLRARGLQPEVPECAQSEWTLESLRERGLLPEVAS